MRRAFTVLEILIVLFLCGLLAALVLPIFLKERNVRALSDCQSRLRRLSDGIAQYRQDYDDTFLLRANAGSVPGWIGNLEPYLYSRQYDCPSAGVLGGPPFAVTDYFYNLRLANHRANSLRNPAFTILAAEGEPASGDYACWDFSRCVGQTASGPVGAVPESARLRHLDGENIAFTDGHVKWFQRSRQVLSPHPEDRLSFALK